MSSNLYYRPVLDKKIAVNSSDRAIEAMRKTFTGGGGRWNLTINELPILCGMAAVDALGPWRELVTAVSEHGEIDVWAEG